MAIMRWSLVLQAVLCLTHGLDEEFVPGKYKKGNAVQLELLEIRKVMRESSPLATEHNVKVVLAEHEPLQNLANWNLVLMVNNTQKSFSSPPNNGSQTEIVFEAELTDSTFVFVSARNQTGVIVGSDFESLEIKDMKSRVAWVGDEYNSSGSSLRVHTGDLQDVKVGSKMCSQEKSPCYFLEDTLPQEISRCFTAVTGTGRPVQQCDDTITRFQRTAEIAQLERSGDNLMVQATFSRMPSKVEVVVFDPSDPTNHLSPADYRCQAEGDPWQVGHCTQQMVGTKDLVRLGVLVVALDHQGYVLESSFATYDGTPVQTASVGVIVGSVIGALLGLFLIVGLGLYLVKKNKKQSKKTSSSTETRYQAAPTHEASPHEEA